MRHNKGESKQPCFCPLFTLNQRLSSPSCMTCKYLVKAASPFSESCLFTSIGSWVQFSMHLVKTLRIIHNRVMHLQLLHCPKSPFFGSLHISPFVQSDGISSFSHIFLRSGSSISALSLGDAFRSSPTMSSTPLLSWAFNLFIADSISDLLGGFVAIFRVVEFKSGNSSGSFLFNSFSKCSAQRLSWLSRSGRGAVRVFHWDCPAFEFS